MTSRRPDHAGPGQPVQRQRDPARPERLHRLVQLRLPAAAVVQPGAEAGAELGSPYLQTKCATCLQQGDEQRLHRDLRRDAGRSCAAVSTPTCSDADGGLQVGYSINDARHLSRRTSQISILASFQLRCSPATTGEARIARCVDFPARARFHPAHATPISAPRCAPARRPAASDAARRASSTAPRPFRYIETQVAFGPRIPGTEAHQRDGGVARQPAAPAGRHAGRRSRWTHVTAEGDTLPLTNFVARFNPAARPSGSSSWRTGTAARPPTAPRRTDSTKPVPGANDGGSGVAAAARRGRRAQARAADGRRGPAVRGRRGLRRLHQDAEGRADRVALLRRAPAARARSRSTRCCSIWSPTRTCRSIEEGNSLVGAPEVVELVWDTAQDLGYAGTFVATPEAHADRRPPGAAEGRHPRHRRGGLRLPLVAHAGRHDRQGERREPPDRGRRGGGAGAARGVAPKSRARVTA